MEVEGVETNSVSRFIDHSFSTEWERFIGDIEVYLKEFKKLKLIFNDIINNNNNDVQSKTIEYLGSKYIIKYYDNANNEISIWFNEKRFILITGDLYNWTENSLSLCHTIFSSFVIAMSTTNTIDIPIFFTLSSIERINNTKLLMGYKIISLIDNNNILINSSTMNYESHLLDFVDNHNELYYLDGIKNVCINKINTFSVGFIEFDQIILDVNIYEDYTYKYEKRPFDDNNDNNKNNNSTYDYINIPYLLPLNTNPILLQKLHINLHYPNITIGSNGNLNLIIDNENYTTLMPSKQPNSCWKVSCQFSSSFTTSSTESSLSQDQCYLKNGSLSCIIRKLLGFYIYWKSFRANNNDIKLGSNNTNDVDIVSDVMELLSNRTQEIVANICTSNEPTSRSNSRSRSQSRSLSISISESGSAASNDNSVDDIDEKIKYTHQIRHFLTCLFDSTMVDDYEGSDNNENIIDQDNDSLYHTPSKEKNIIISNNQTLSTTTTAFEGDSWLSLCSLYMGSIDGNATLMSEFWHTCIKELRKRWEIGLPFSHINRSISKTVSPNTTTTTAIINQQKSDKAIWKQTLWEEVIHRINCLENVEIALPDLSQSLLTQKIQMIQMCIVLKDEDTFCDAPFDMQNIVASFPNISLNSRECKTINTPKLLRRLPMTTDAVAFHEHMVQKIISGQSSSTKQPLLRWQILMPAIVSDIKSFKSINPDADHITFMEWYTKDKNDNFPYPDEIEHLEEVYDSCNPVPAADQKVMFQAEAEAEKAFSIIEKLSTIEISAEILIHALNSIYVLLVESLKEFCLWNYGNNNDADTSLSSFDTDLNSVRNDIDNVIKMININLCGIKNSESDNNNNSNNNDDDDSVYIMIDNISTKVEMLEEQAARAREISEYLDIPSSPEKCHIITCLCKKGSFEPSNNSQLQIVINIAKKISKGSNNHNWHSHDGRELGIPTRKVYDIQCQKSIKLTDAYDSHHAPFSNNKSNNSDHIAKHHFTAIAENNKLRVSFNIKENEN